MDAQTPGSTLFDVELPGLVGIQGIESFVEARRVQQELQVLFAAVFEEVDDFFVLLHGSDDLGLFERARVVLVDHNKALPGGLRAEPSVTRRRARRLRTPGAVRSGTRS